jgi:hypothetical protein
VAELRVACNNETKYDSANRDSLETKDRSAEENDKKTEYAQQVSRH